jgi:hypothetical protein
MGLTISCVIYIEFFDHNDTMPYWVDWFNPSCFSIFDAIAVSPNILDVFLMHVVLTPTLQFEVVLRYMTHNDSLLLRMTHRHSMMTCRQH